MTAKETDIEDKTITASHGYTHKQTGATGTRRNIQHVSFEVLVVFSTTALQHLQESVLKLFCGGSFTFFKDLENSC